MLSINIVHRALAIVLTLATLLLPMGAHAAVDMFLDLGTQIPGESVDKAHPKQIDVLAWSWGASSTSSALTGAGKVTLQDISITKYVDKATPKLLMACAAGQPISQATLYVRKAGEIPFEYIKITLSDVYVTSITSGGSGGEDRLTENISLSISKFEYKYTPQRPDGTADTSIITRWDVLANKPY